MSDHADRLCVAMLVVAFVMFAATGLFQHSSFGEGFQKTVTITPDDNSTPEAPPVTTIEAAEITSAPPVTEDVTSAEPLRINLNTATSEELEQLYSIGPKLAGEIIRYREANGAFNNIEEILCVNGIGEKIFSSIKDQIYVDHPYYPEETTAAVPEPAAQETEPERRLEDCVPINIDTADAETLMLLPYVDEEIANKIIELREQLKGFSHPYELLIIDELSDKQVAEIIEYVCIEKDKEE